MPWAVPAEMGNNNVHGNSGARVRSQSESVSPSNRDFCWCLRDDESGLRTGNAIAGGMKRKISAGQNIHKPEGPWFCNFNNSTSQSHSGQDSPDQVGRKSSKVVWWTGFGPDKTMANNTSVSNSGGNYLCGRTA